jgi:hypothetical protein
MAHQRLFIVSLTVIFSFSGVIPVTAQASDLIQPYENSVIDSSEPRSEDKIYELITGKIKRVNTRQIAESSEFVHGRKQSTTWKVLDSSSTRDIAAHYLEQLQGKGNIIFECGGRGCGSSNYWANTVFKKAALFGPEQYQYYMLAWLEVEQAYIMIYLAQRGTGARYIHQVVITDVNNNGIRDQRLVDSELRLLGRISFWDQVTDAQVASIAESIRINRHKLLAVVVHEKLAASETIQDSIERTQQFADTIVERVKLNGINDTEIQAHGVGPIAPTYVGAVHEDAIRIEVVLFR